MTYSLQVAFNEEKKKKVRNTILQEAGREEQHGLASAKLPWLLGKTHLRESCSVLVLVLSPASDSPPAAGKGFDF